MSKFVFALVTKTIAFESIGANPPVVGLAVQFQLHGIYETEAAAEAAAKHWGWPPLESGPTQFGYQILSTELHE